MKWPSSLTLLRHAESSYNALKKKKAELPEWEPFTTLFHEGYDANDLKDRVFDGTWPNPELVRLTHVIHQKLREIFGNSSDFSTPITETGWQQARATGRALRETEYALPHIIHVSPYLRTRQTLDGITQEWPKLKDVRTVEEERIREQEHGIETIYNDWRIFFVHDPHQAVWHKEIGPYYWRHPHGESVCDVRERTRDYLAMLIRENSEEDIMAITHHLTILSTRANLERWGQDQFTHADKHDKPLNCGVTTYYGKPTEGKDGKLVLEQYNTTYYDV